MRHSRHQLWIVVVPLFLCAVATAMASASQPFELARGAAPHHPRQPQVAVDAQGSIHIIYGIGDLAWYRRSDDGGQSFSEPVDLPAAHQMSLGMRRGPRIAVADKEICVTVIGGKRGKGQDGDLLAMRSVDGGKTWTAPMRINDVTDSAREGLHAMCAGPQGEMCCVWLDLRNGHTEVMSSCSTDGGVTWSKNVLVYKSPDGNVCECCHPSVTIDGRGRIHVQWRNAVDGTRDIYVASSTNGGRTFGKASKLGIGTWPLTACPMDGGAIAAGRSDKLASVWRRDKTVFLYLEGEREERRLGVGEQPWIATTDAGPFVVWLERRGDVVYLLKPGNAAPLELATHGADPVIAAGPGGRGPVVAAWETRDAKSSTIQCQVIAHRK